MFNRSIFQHETAVTPGFWSTNSNCSLLRFVPELHATPCFHLLTAAGATWPSYSGIRPPENVMVQTDYVLVTFSEVNEQARLFVSRSAMMAMMNVKLSATSPALVQDGPGQSFTNLPRCQSKHSLTITLRPLLFGHCQNCYHLPHSSWSREVA